MTLRLITSAHPILEIKYIHKITHLSSINGY